MRNNTTRQFVKLSKQRLDGWQSTVYRHLEETGGKRKLVVRAGVARLNYNRSK